MRGLMLEGLDLRKPMSGRKIAILRIQTEVLRVMVERLLEKGFYWILPVILSKSTDPLWPDPEFSIEKKVEVEIYGEKVSAMQSMIVHKRVLVSLGPEKIFILSPNIRIERRDRAATGRHLYEFTQFEVEVAYAKMQDIFGIYEELITESIKYVRKHLSRELEVLGRELKIPQTPFKVYKRSELEEKYGASWQDEVSRIFEDPIWVTGIPREFYDYEDPETGEWRNYDLILPEGYGEVISGAEREYEYEKLAKKLERDGLDKSNYKILLDLAKEGLLKPSAGAGLGIERFIAYIVGARHVAEVQPFPRIPGIVPEI
ncbi:MAG: asparagine synthetase A [Thaumarchaeota archaeon]|jgi:asparaginyl-tRNA synthetase|nr:asparagine synthetase A [Nitrososphaerota archaeon]MCL7386318.1 asparagine synthetase A [Candidatus Wolframiiraptor allenii]MCL7393318.1 asparagine synthetase A [Candidatus Wolframiiraptor allenii]